MSDDRRGAVSADSPDDRHHGCDFSPGLCRQRGTGIHDARDDLVLIEGQGQDVENALADERPGEPDVGLLDRRDDGQVWPRPANLLHSRKRELVPRVDLQDDALGLTKGVRKQVFVAGDGMQRQRSGVMSAGREQMFKPGQIFPLREDVTVQQAVCSTKIVEVEDGICTHDFSARRGALAVF
jgi:hypothetical protein